MLSVPTHDEIAAIDRSLPLYVVVENRTTTPKIGVIFEPDTDNGKHFHVVVVRASLDDPDQDVSDMVKFVPNSTPATFEVSRDVYDRMKRGPADHSMVLLTESEHDVEDNDDAPDVVDKPGEVGRGMLPKVPRFENGNYGWIKFSGDVGSLECGWRAKDKACSKLEQYKMRERAMLKLAKGALETKRFSMMEMMQAVDGVPKDLRRGLVVYGQGITGMYRAIAEYMGEDEFEPWTRLECMFDQYVPGMGRGKKRMRAASD